MSRRRLAPLARSASPTGVVPAPASRRKEERCAARSSSSTSGAVIARDIPLFSPAKEQRHERHTVRRRHKVAIETTTLARVRKLLTGRG